jgi:transposase-like protein
MKKSSNKKSKNVNLEKLRSSIQLDLKRVDLSHIIKCEMENFGLQLGLIVIEQFMQAEVEQLIGPRYSRERDGEICRWGSQDGSVVLGAQKTPISKPRARKQLEDGSSEEVKLASYAAFNNPNTLSKSVLKRMLSGVSGRNFAQTVEQVSDSSGLSKSTFSRKAIKATTAMAKQFEDRSLKELGIQVILIDGTREGEEMNIVAVGIAEDGTKHFLGIEQGATEHSAVCIHLLQDLIDRGLDAAGEYLFILDGSKALKKAVKAVFGKNTLIQRCLEHKIRNIMSYLPKHHQGRIRRLLRTAWTMNDHEDARQALTKICKTLKNINETAEESLLEALEDTLTLHKLEAPKQLRDSLQTTNIIESWNSMAKDHSKQVKKWKDADHVKRWLTVGMLEAERRSHKLKGFAHLKQLKQKMRELIENAEQKLSSKTTKINSKKINKIKQAA